MPYLVDGHNLVPRAGLRLDAVDDELELISMLQEFARRARKDIEVYFDGAPEGVPLIQRFGRVKAYFVNRRSSADEAIQRRLQQLAGSARNWIVISSDRQVVAAAKASHARCLSSEGFALQLVGEKSSAQQTPERDRAALPDGMSAEEVSGWLDIFKRGRNSG